MKKGAMLLAIIPLCWKILLGALVLLSGTARAEEAVSREGQRYVGTLRDRFVVAGSGKLLPWPQLRLVHFPESVAPLPRCQSWHQLLLPGEQQLTGALSALGPEDVRFRISTGEAFTIARQQLQSIVQADGFLTQWVEDFEGPINQRSWLGNPIISLEHAFSGKKSLFVNSTSGETGLLISTPQKHTAAYRASVHFFDPGLKESAVATVRFFFQAQEARLPLTLALTGHGYGSDNGAGFRLSANAGWHILQLDWKDGEARAFIDDFLISSRSIPKNARVESLRFSFAGKGGIWFDALHLSEKAPPLKRTPGPPELDEIWLASGEQIFGQVLQADERAVVLDARFGKQSYAWGNVRGIFFRSEAKPAAVNEAVEVRFRSGPGVSADRLLGEIIDLDDRRLLLRHGVLGKLEIARTRLERIRFLEAAAK